MSKILYLPESKYLCFAGTNGATEIIEDSLLFKTNEFNSAQEFMQYFTTHFCPSEAFYKRNKILRLNKSEIKNVQYFELVIQ